MLGDQIVLLAKGFRVKIQRVLGFAGKMCVQLGGRRLGSEKCFACGIGVEKRRKRRQSQD